MWPMLALHAAKERKRSHCTVKEPLMLNLWPFTKHHCSFTFVLQVCSCIKGYLNLITMSKWINRKLIFLSGQVWSKYTVNVASQSTWVNPGDNYTANCNVPGLEAIDYVSTLKVKWFHNGQPLTSLCEFLSSELAQKYSCKVLLPKTNNISLLLTVKSNYCFNTLETRSDQCFEKEVTVQFKGIQVRGLLENFADKAFYEKDTVYFE